jgi:hypothetical protein
MLKKPEPKAAPSWRDRKTKIHGDNQTMADGGGDNMFSEEAFGTAIPAGTMAANQDKGKDLSNKVNDMFGGDDDLAFEPPE